VVKNTTIHWLKIDLSRAEEELAKAQKTYREKHPAVATAQAQIDSIQARIDEEVSNILTSFARDYEMALVKERDLTKAFEEQKQEAFELNQKAITYNILANEIDSNRWVYNSLLQNMKEMSISERLETSNIRIVDLAQVPRAPININTQRTLMMAIILGLASGVGLSFFFEYLDNSIKTPEDLKQYLQISFLGFIPRMAAKSLKSFRPEHVVAEAPKSIVSEAYRSLRTSVSISAINDTSSAPEGSTLLVTSAEPSEGKSCTIANLAIAMAQSGRKTLVVDCDFRRPQIHKIFNVENESGFADLLSHFKNKGKIHLKRTAIPNLDVFPCGKIPPNPSELLESPGTKKIIDALATRYDTVLIDSPPINSVTDPVILSRLANGVVLIIRAGETKRDIVQQAAEQLNSAGANLLGGVINSVDMRKNKYYYYYAYHYSHYYGKEDMAIALT
jgi:capsular exopolysaccharide synthesis family protein